MAALDLVRVRNLGDRPINGAYGGTGYLIPVGGETLMERECAIKDYGDFDARNLSMTEEKLRFRDREFRRIRGIYGVSPGARIPVVDSGGRPTLDEKGVPQETLADTVYMDRLPKVEIYLMDGTRVTTVIEDPEGETLPLEGASETDKDKALAEMKRQIEALTQSVVSMQEGKTQAPVDSPQTDRPKPKPAKVTASQSVGD